jgi:hypothetical protein
LPPTWQPSSDDKDPAAIELRTNTKIEIQFQDRVQTIVTQGKTNVQIVTQNIHDKEVLSDGWQP